MGKIENVYRILVEKPEEKRPLGRPIRRVEDNIKIDLKERKLEGMHWIHLDQDGGLLLTRL
jgi:hypothetical protein